MADEAGSCLLVKLENLSEISQIRTEIAKHLSKIGELAHLEFNVSLSGTHRELFIS